MKKKRFNFSAEREGAFERYKIYGLLLMQSSLFYTDTSLYQNNKIY